MGKFGRPARQGMMAKVKPPRLFNVVFLYDSKTPMEFVAELLVAVFHQPLAEAIDLMLEVQLKGRSRVGPYPREIAEQRLLDARAKAAALGFPLILKMEEA